MDRRTRNTGIAGVAVVVVVVIVLLYVLPKADVCKLQLEPPEHVQVSDFKSSDFKAMANFDGHLIYTKKSGGDKKSVELKYLPLKLESIEQRGSFEVQNKEQVRLKLATNCADVSVVFDRTDFHDKTSMYVFYFEVDNISSDGDKTVCTTSSNLALKPEQYYSCQKSQTLECRSNKKVVAQLQIDQIEFEVDGNPEKIKQGKFSKSKVMCP